MVNVYLAITDLGAPLIISRDNRTDEMQLLAVQDVTGLRTILATSLA